MALSYSDLAKSTSGLQNKNDYPSYLELLESRGWLRKSVREIPSSSRQGVLEHRWKKRSYYEITGKGRAFFELFPQDWDPGAAKQIMPKPGLFEIRAMLEAVREIEDSSLSLFNWSDKAVPNRKNRARYLRVLVSLEWIQKKRKKRPKLSALSQGVISYYERYDYKLTSKGKVFVELFFNETVT